MFTVKRRLKGKVFQREFIKMKPIIAERDNRCCRVCGDRAQDIHHIIFRSQGGTNDADNLICLCRRCHEAAHGVDAKKIAKELQEILKE